MAAFRIAVIGGDGIGPEVIAQAVRVAERAARHDRAEVNWNHLPWSSAYYKSHGRILPADGWDTLERHDAILFGAIGSPDVPEAVTAHELLIGPVYYRLLLTGQPLDRAFAKRIVDALLCAFAP